MRRRGFTVMELMVVVGIIIIMTALAIPAVNKFLEGQKLSQSGRILQSAFNEARRAAITQRTKNYLVFFVTTDELNQRRYAIRRYRDRFGYEGDAFFLLPQVAIESNGQNQTAPVAERARGGMTIPIFNDLPPEDGPVFQGAAKRPDAAAYEWLEFKKDGTIALHPSGTALFDKQPPTVAGVNLFDLNMMIDTVPDSTADEVDFNLMQNEKLDRRCFIDIDINTGRVRFRVARCVP